MKQITAREAAFLALERCRRDGAWSSMAFDQVIRESSMDSRDVALASRLCMGVLQNDRYLDYYIDLFCNTKLEPKVRDILRLGCYQILLLDKIPDRAAVSESVTLCRHVGCTRASGLVNAVLRKLAAQRDYLPEIPEKGSAAYLSVRYSHPDWLAQQLIDRYGYVFTERFFAQNNNASGLTIQINSLKVDPEDYKRALQRTEIAYSEDPAIPGCLTLSGGNVTSLPGYEEGLFYVQDKAARAAVCIAEPCPEMHVLDACAAPGGKSFAAALAMQDRGSILSCDIHEKKLHLIREGAARLGIETIQTQARDARLPQESFLDSFDLVLADVPCSGFGVISKRPEIRNKSKQDIAALPQIQKQIIHNLANFVKPGGVLLYSTCTILEEENGEQIKQFLLERRDFEAEPFSAAGIHSDTGMYTFWPHIDGTDGFFVAKLRRKPQ